VTTTSATIQAFLGVLFDVDGTLIDSNGAHAAAWHKALGHHGIRLSLSDVRQLIGMGGDKLLRTVAGIDERSELGQHIVTLKKKLFADRLPGLDATSGARPLLEFLRARGMTLATATSSDAPEMRALLSQARVDDMFAARASKDDAHRSKPDPDIVAAALRRIDLGPRDVVMVGDTPYDIEAATAAGVATIALRCGGTWTDDDLRGASLIADDPAALLELWRPSWNEGR